MYSAGHAPSTPRRFKPRGRHPDKALSAAFVRTAPPGRYCDGQGLYLFVQPSGTRSWVQRIAIRGRRHELGLGSAVLVPLAEARAKALANRKIAREGGDPLAEKRRAEVTPTFAAAAARVLEQKQAGWSNSRHESTWIRSLETYAFPRIGGRLVSEVTSADVLEVLTPIWHEKAQTARRVRQRIRTVLEWAVAMELRPDNPCDRIGPVLGPQRAPVQHMRALPHRDVPAAVNAVRASGAAPVVRLAFELLVLTAARWGEVRGAEWTEIDTSGPGVDHTSDAHEGAARAPGSALWTGYGDSRGGADARQRLRSARVPQPYGDAAARKEAAPDAPGPEHRGRTAWLPVHLPGLGSRRERTTRARLSRPRSRTWSRTKSRPPMRGRTCSSAGGGSWSEWAAYVDGDRRSAIAAESR